MPSARDVFATGDTAYAATDDQGHNAMMSCQHAIPLRHAAGHNAAADLLGVPLRPYTQAQYITCLTLGESAAVVTSGWDRKVVFTGLQVKAVKEVITTKLIDPPKPNVGDAFAAAGPAFKLPMLLSRL